MFFEIIYIGIGGFIGSNLRHFISNIFSGVLRFPLGTLIVNCLGSILLGFLMVIAKEVLPFDSKLKLFLATGLLGAFTTFSWETFRMINDGKYIIALGNIGLNIICGLLSVSIGFIVGRALIL